MRKKLKQALVTSAKKPEKGAQSSPSQPSKDSENAGFASGQKSEAEKISPGAAKADIRPRKTRLIFEYIYMNKGSQSKNLISAENNFNFMGARIQYRKPLSMEKGHDLVFSGFYLKSLGTSQDTFEVPDLVNLYLQYLYDPNWLPFDVFAGIHYENQIFVNLDEFNQGLAKGENNVLWAQAGLEKVFALYGKKMIVSASYFQLAAGDSSFNLQGNKLSGTKTSAEITCLWSEKIRFGGGMLVDKMRAGDYSLNQTSAFASFQYSFL